MSKTTAALAALGVVAGLGVAALPLSSYAAADSATSKSKDIAMQLEVTNTISLTVETKDNGDANLGTNGSITATDGLVSEINFGKLTADDRPAEATVTARVKTNSPSGYTLTIVGTGNNANLTLDGGTNTIKTGKPAQGTSAWGYKHGEASLATGATNGVTNATASTDWENIPTAAAELIKSNKPTQGAATEGGVSGDTIDLTFGASVSVEQPTGIYKGGVTLTASVGTGA